MSWETEAVHSKHREWTAVVPGAGGSGEPVFSLLLKRSYRIRPGDRAEQLESALPFVESDVYYEGGPESAPVREEGELVAFKSATDVVIMGRAHSPRGIAAQEMDVEVSVGQVSKVIRVMGDRQCVHRPNQTPVFTEPESFTHMDIRYDRAYGGEDFKSDPQSSWLYPRNHRGRGYVLQNLGESVDGMLLPNLEDPADPLTPERIIVGSPDRWYEQPLPQSLGWYEKLWYPRSVFTGVIPSVPDPDVITAEELMGLVPHRHIALGRRCKLPSFDVRFNNGASPGLALKGLRGDEGVILRGLTPDGVLNLQLPGDVPRLMLDIGLGERELDPALHSVVIRVDDMELDLVWGGAHSYPGLDWLPEMTRMNVEVA